MTKFSEMEYKRPDIDYIFKQYDDLSKETEKALNKERLVECIYEHEKILSGFQTQSCLSYIRHSIDTKDAFYSGEKDFFDENTPLFEQKVQEFYDKLISSKLKDEAEKICGRLFFKNIEMSRKCFSPEIIPDLQKENALVSAYQNLIAGARIPFDGKILNLSKLGPYKISKDREVRKSALHAEGEFYLSVKEKLDEIFASLVEIRTQIASKLGYESFTDVAYLRMNRNCYSKKDVANFRENVKKYIVPAVVQLKKKQSVINGIPDMKMYDDSFIFPGGNAKPHGNEEDILASAKEMYTRMSEKTGEFISFLYDNELLDVKSKDGKAAGGYCESLPDYRATFIFSNFNGTSGDVDVLTHEAGHAFADYMVRDFPFRETMNPTLEACETHSMSMEFFAWRYLDLFYGDDTGKAEYFHLSDSFSFIPYGCMVDEFQHIMYDNPFLSYDERQGVWESLEREYRPYLDRSGIPFYGEGRGWQRQLHIYHNPFYYIDYCLAQTEALSFWAESRMDYDKAFEKYLSFVSFGGTKTFRELCAAAGMDSPFEESCIKKVVEEVTKWLKEK